MIAHLDQVVFEPHEGFDEVNRRLIQLGLSDGLPLVPPTRARIEAMIGQRDAHTAHAILPPQFVEATVYRVAVCAVMAGCQPAEMPLLLSAVEAVADEAFNLLGIQTTTGAAAPAFIVNGPIAEQLGINAQSNALGPGTRANATIGRALSLALRNIGGAVPGQLDMATMGQPGKYTFCFAEHEQANPWGPLHVSLGYEVQQSTVTVVATVGTMEVRDDRSRRAESLLTTFAQSMLSAGSITGNGLLCGGRPLILLAPDHASIIAREKSRREAQEFLFELARLPVTVLPAEMRAYLEQRCAARGNALNGNELRVAVDPSDILLVVVGGAGNKSTYIPTWGGGLSAVTRVIPDR